ncbi:carboxylesterase/lipase family protein [Caulobacter sp. KR2-114]|uniref:carboxylesterase/lipase family protein n=1 Tax=Caulobacter sp. KR2-114 TaxID=3400912 RepID=UPI003C11B2A4
MPSAPLVDTAQGQLSGLHLPGGVQAFLGVPFAGSTAPPHRFRAPRPPRAWNGVRDATAPGPICPQNDDDGVGAYAGLAQSEDCLNLNIWTPACDGGARGVFVFFHGGAFVTGAGNLSLYDGARLAAAEDIVVVTANYRLGVLGWPPFAAWGPAESRNLGLLDAVAALRWIGENIAVFGGDPARVTHGGQSAGAMISAMLTRLPEAEGLFARAAPMSLQTLVGLEPDRQDRYAAEILTELGAADLEPLKTAPVATLLQAQWTVRQRALHVIDTVEQLRWPFMPNRDGLLIGEDPADWIAPGSRQRAARAPIMAGYTTEELVVTPLQLNANPTAATLSTRAVTVAGLTRLFDERAAQRIWETYAKAYPAASESELCGLIATDKDYRMPAVRLAEAAAGGETHLYAFDYRGRGPYFPNAHHALDLPFWFGATAEPRYAGFFLGGEATEAERALTRDMQRALGGFVRGEGPGWAPYDPVRRETMVFGLVSGAKADPASDTRRVWDDLVP